MQYQTLNDEISGGNDRQLHIEQEIKNLDRTIQEKESQLSVMRNAIKKAEDGNKIK